MSTDRDGFKGVDNEARVREIVREELAAFAEGLRHDCFETIVGDAGSTLQPLNPVLQDDEGTGAPGVSARGAHTAAGHHD
jgi:hypothetical protein